MPKQKITTDVWDHPSSIGVNLLYTNYVPCLYGRSHIITHGPAAHPPLTFEISSDLPDKKGGEGKEDSVTITI